MKTLSTVALSLSLLVSGACSSSMDKMDNSRMSGDMRTNSTIADVAMSTGMHNTLVTALKTAGLADMLMQSGSYTVFAPTDAAFAKLPAGTVDMLMRPENRDKLRSILQYHVVPGRVNAQQVMGMPMARSASGQDIRISTMGNTVMVGNATVIKADVMASNGIVHVIDTVLMPPGM